MSSDTNINLSPGTEIVEDHVLKQVELRDILHGSAAIRLATSDVDPSEIGLRHVEAGYKELTFLKELGMPMLDTSIGYAQKIDGHQGVVATLTPYQEGVNLRDQLKTDPTSVEAENLLQVVDVLLGYLDERIGSEEPFMRDIFEARQYMLSKDGQIILVDTEPMLCSADSGWRHQYEADAVINVQNMLIAAGISGDRLEEFVTKRDELIYKIKAASESISEGDAKWVIKDLQISLEKRAIIQDTMGMLYAFNNATTEEINAIN